MPPFATCRDPSPATRRRIAQTAIELAKLARLLPAVVLGR